MDIKRKVLVGLLKHRKSLCDLYAIVTTRPEYGEESGGCSVWFVIHSLVVIDPIQNQRHR